MGNDAIRSLRWCANCLSMSTRPRIKFDERGWCNACVWAEEKQTLDWGARQKELELLLGRHRATDGRFDCLAPVSGGKDGSYVSYNLKHKYGMNPLAVTISPGVGNAEHIIDGLRHRAVDAVATANLFHFIGSAFLDARQTMAATGVEMAHWIETDYTLLRDKFASFSEPAASQGTTWVEQ